MVEIFTKEMNYIRREKRYFLLNSFYDYKVDKLYIFYKDTETGEKIKDIIEAPEVPIWISNSPLKEPIEYMHKENLTKYNVRYKNKAEEIKSITLNAKKIKYKDKYGNERVKVHFPDGLKDIEYINPNVFGADIPIEELVYTQWTLLRYENQRGLEFEKIDLPDFRIGAFDIETIPRDEKKCERLYPPGKKYIKDEDYIPDKFVHINVWTYVDEADKEGYINFLLDPRCPRQQEILDKLDSFIADFKETAIKSIDESTLKDQKFKEEEKQFIRDMKIYVNAFSSEADLIKDSIILMNHTKKPDFNLAFNMTYDVGVSQRRIEELGLPIGLWNCNREDLNTEPYFRRTIKIDRENPYGSDDPWEFKGDSIVSPKERTTEFNTTSTVQNWDLQTVHWNNNKFLTPPSVSLEYTANKTIGLGKHDFSHVCNSVAKLPFYDFWVHLIYSLLDSLLLVFINRRTKAIQSKLSYMFATKTPYKASMLASKSIPRCIHAEAMYLDYVPACNINALLIDYNSDKDLEKMEKVLGVSYLKKTRTLLNKRRNKEIEVGGAIVVPTHLFHMNFKDTLKAWNVLNGEVHMSLLRLIERVIYYDYKSHYPFQIHSNNIARDCYVGTITSILDENDEVIKSRDVNKNSSKYVDNLGFINLALINKDPVKFGQEVMGLPSLIELGNNIGVKFDDTPKFTPTLVPVFEKEIEDKVLLDLVSILKKLNRKNIKNTLENAILRDRGYFPLHNLRFEFCGDCVSYNYKGLNLKQLLIPEVEQNDVPILATVNKKCIVNFDKIPRELRSKPANLGSLPWYPFTQEMIDALNEERTNCVLDLGEDVIIYQHKSGIYWNPEVYTKMLKRPHKHIEYSNLYYRYIKREKTACVELKFNIKVESLNIDIEIIQQKNILLLK